MTAGKRRESFGFYLVQVARLWRAEIDRRLSPQNMTQAKWLTLLHLSRLDAPTTQKRLAAAVGVQEPTLVRMLDRLEADGLIARRPIEGDRRANSLHLTRKAVPSLYRIKTVTETVRDEIFAGIADADIDTCLMVFERLSRRLQGEAVVMRGIRAQKARKTAQ